MRRALLLHVIFGLGLGLGAAQQVTVLQLERVLDSAAQQQAEDADSIGNTELLRQLTSDGDLAPRIAKLQLTQRLTNLTRAELIRKYHLGPLSQAQLELIADRSALLEPPPQEIVGIPAPSPEEQKAMVREAGDFVFQSLTHLPDFFALLTTTRFNDADLNFNGHPMSDHAAMHLVGRSEREITFSAGREVFDSAQSRHATNADGGLQSQGEFGAEPAVVFLDVPHGHLEFEHWERGDSRPVAVFAYAVPESDSHYEVKYACNGKPAFRTQPAYRGTLTIDPAAGVITRMTLETESKGADPISTVQSVIEYGPVNLGKHRYFCPLRSVAFSVQQADACARPGRRQKLQRPIAMLNRILFSDYHRLGSEMNVVPEEPRLVPPVASTSDPGPALERPASQSTGAAPFKPSCR